MKWCRIIAVVLLTSVLCPLTSDSAVPSAINYQGRLTDGTNLVNATVSLVLRVYDDPAAGSLLCEDSNDVAVVDGLYSTHIGGHVTAGSLAAIAATTNAWVEVSVDGTILTPRERIVSVTYALNAETLDNMDSSAFATGTPVYVETDPVWTGVSNSVQTQIGAKADSNTAWAAFATLQALNTEVGDRIGADASLSNQVAQKLDSNAWAAADSSTNYVRRTGDTMTGALNINAGTDVEIIVGGTGTNIAIGASANAYDAGVAIGRAANASMNGAAIGWQANARSAGVSVGSFSDGNTDGAAVGYNSKAYTTGAALGRDANGASRGAAVGYSSAGNDEGAAVGHTANGSSSGAAVGYLAGGSSSGAALGRAANGANSGAAVGFMASGGDSGAAVGRESRGEQYGAAVGRQANGMDDGVAAGYLANGNFHGVAVGSRATGTTYGAAVGTDSFAQNTGAAIGQQANAGDYGAAAGAQALGMDYGAALGYRAIGANYGVGMGYRSVGGATNVAVGVAANAQYGSERIAIGHDVTNQVDDSARLRGTLYLDGGTGVLYRSTFGSGAWTSLSDVYVRKAGDTMTGVLTINAGADNDLVISSAGNDVMIGPSANGNLNGIGIGYMANAYNNGVAMGYQATGSQYGVGIGWQANGDSSGVAAGTIANAQNYGVALGAAAIGNDEGVAVGRDASGSSNSVAVGHAAKGGSGGAAVGYGANAYSGGAALGSSANAIGYGAAVGNTALATNFGAAVGYQSRGNDRGVAAGYSANGTRAGVALGYKATAPDTNIAIGLWSSATGGSERIAVGHNVTNDIDDSARVRGTLYLDGGTGVYVRPAFGAGAWMPLLDAGNLNGATSFVRKTGDRMSGPLDMGGNSITNVNTNSIVFTDGTVISAAGVQNWDTAFGWGNHAAAGYASAADLTTASNSLQAQVNAKLDSNTWAAADSTTNHVKRTGDTMTGVLTMNAGADRELTIGSAGTNIAMGANANGNTAGLAIGRGANGYSQGVAVGHGANGYVSGAALGYQANANSMGVSIGYQSTSQNGVAVGYIARASSQGTAVGGGTDARTQGVAIGQNANGYATSVAVGHSANGANYGTALGYNALGYDHGAAVGYYANAWTYGAAVGLHACAWNQAVAVGAGAFAAGTNIVIGCDAEATSGVYQVAIGYNATNQVPNSALLRGTLYLDGGSNIYVRTNFGSGAWTELASLFLPPGVMMPYGGSAAPAGWLLCDGSEVSRSTYAALFSAIGTNFGAGNGSTTFNLPDLRGRIPLGRDNMGGVSADRVTSSEADWVGGSGGAESHTLTTSEMPSHSHSMDVTTPLGVVVDAGSSYQLYYTVAGNTGSAGGGQAHNNTQPYLTMSYIIKQ